MSSLTLKEIVTQIWGKCKSTYAKKSIYSDTAISRGRKQGSKIGENSIAYGYDVVASEFASHAEGYSTIASGGYSHAEGSGTTASNSCSHAEGINTTASGEYSHSSGLYTIAGYPSQMVIGQYNNNKEGNLFEVGNGFRDRGGNVTRSNALEVNKDGTVTAAKDFKVGDVSLTEKIKQIDEELNGVRYLIIGNAEEV